MGSSKGKKSRFNRTKKAIKSIGGVAQRLFSPVSKVTDDVSAEYNEHSTLKKTVISFIKLRYLLLFSMILILLVAAYVFAVRNDNAASAVMSLNYEESAKGLSPNSTRFNIYELKSPEVIEKMLYYCGIDKDSVDIDKMVDAISISPTNSKGFTVDDYYIATSYAVGIKKIAGLSEISTHDLLTFLCKAYTDVFYARYADNRSILNFNVSEFDGLEFLQVAELMQLKVQQQSKYLNTRVKENKTFTDGVSEETFKSLAVKLDDFLQYDIERYRSYVLQTGIARDKAHYVRVLNYVNFTDTLKFDKDMAAFDARYDGVSMYNDTMTSVVMIPTIDRTRGNYYMSKTMTGMDYMTAQADSSLTSAQAIAQKIETNTDVIGKIQAGANRRADIDKAYQMIEDMQVKFGEFGKQIEALDKAYAKYKTKDYITFRIKGLSLAQRLRVDLLFDLAVLFVAGAFVALWIKFRYFGKGSKK